MFIAIDGYFLLFTGGVYIQVRPSSARAAIASSLQKSRLCMDPPLFLDVNQMYRLIPTTRFGFRYGTLR